jgi:hypothetical protein
MTYKMHGALIASLGAVALMLPAGEAIARSGAAPGGSVASARAMVRGPIAPAFRHHRRNSGGAFWPGDYGDGSYPSGGEPYADVPPQTSQDVHYTTTYDVPWDWAHRFPPNVAPSDKPYVSSCPVETVKTTGRDGSEQTINVMRCY